MQTAFETTSLLILLCHFSRGNTAGLIVHAITSIGSCTRTPFPVCMYHLLFSPNTFIAGFHFAATLTVTAHHTPQHAHPVDSTWKTRTTFFNVLLSPNGKAICPPPSNTISAPTKFPTGSIFYFTINCTQKSSINLQTFPVFTPPGVIRLLNTNFNLAVPNYGMDVVHKIGHYF